MPPSTAPNLRQELRYGSARTPLVRVVPDAVYPNMWRMVWPGGRVSDLVNISRIKDAAAAICERGPPARDPRCFHWESDHSNSRSGARGRVLKPGPVSDPSPARQWGHRPFIPTAGKAAWAATTAGGNAPRPGETLFVKGETGGTYAVVGAETGAIMEPGIASSAEAASWVDGFGAGRARARRRHA